ncbi:hypothetical protein IMCC3317_19730 [Kordia antarctica]|uniref:Addiction module component n=1 Tax=Kordia antarctica TaxID=1218801 RepID=A0A7L4ZJ89_9FLAO|nr:hypothetical protein IMCC3317_19730 [Kordia antarctica]
MTALDKIKNRLIDQILITKNEELLSTIENLFSSTETEEKLVLDSYQLEMLMMSEKDIDEGKLISESDLEKLDAEWMD